MITYRICSPSRGHREDSAYKALLSDDPDHAHRVTMLNLMRSMHGVAKASGNEVRFARDVATIPTSDCVARIVQPPSSAYIFEDAVGLRQWICRVHVVEPASRLAALANLGPRLAAVRSAALAPSQDDLFILDLAVTATVVGAPYRHFILTESQIMEAQLRCDGFVEGAAPGPATVQIAYSPGKQV